RDSARGDVRVIDFETEGVVERRSALERDREHAGRCVADEELLLASCTDLNIAHVHQDRIDLHAVHDLGDGHVIGTTKENQTLKQSSRCEPEPEKCGHRTSQRTPVQLLRGGNDRINPRASTVYGGYRHVAARRLEDAGSPLAARSDVVVASAAAWSRVGAPFGSGNT